MCGISGVFSSNLKKYEIDKLSKSLSDSLKHRGPDSTGSWFDEKNGILLSHNRLAINDLSPLGAQPMHSLSERYVIVFNGEVYNHKDLRKNLEHKGVAFIGKSDTEVILAVIEFWGLYEAVKLFSGMFVFALWDKEERILHLCRDRIGEKPLYYGWIDNALYFSSELSAIETVTPSNKLTVSTEGLHHLFKYGFIPTPYSIYNEISKLPVSSIVTLELDVAKPKAIHQYWSLSDSVKNGIRNPIETVEEAKSKLDSTLQNIIGQQLSADVDVGLFLSGGIDSTTVASIAQNISNTKVKTFTIGFPDKAYDESIYAEDIAKHLGTDHLTMRINGNDAKNTIPYLADIYCEPFADSSQIPSYLVSRLAKEHVTVCLSGDGGDELFAGYNRYLLTNKLWNKLEILPVNIRKFIGSSINIMPNRLRNIFMSPFYNVNKVQSDSKIQKLIGILGSNNIMDAYDFLSSYWQDPSQIIKSSYANIKHIDSEVPSNLSFIDKAMYVDLVRYLEGDNLVKTDRASMAVSLETRLPLLDHKLIELAWSIPLSMKVKNNQSKWILRQVLAQYVPDKLMDRPKMGFSIPIASWLRNELKDWAGDLLHSLDSNEYLNKELIIKAWEEHQLGMYDNSHKLWAILMFLSWQFNQNRIDRVAA